MKPKVAFYWCASCGGCEEAVVDLAEQLLDVTAAVDIVFWPVALDFKDEDVAALPEGTNRPLATEDRPLDAAAFLAALPRDATAAPRAPMAACPNPVQCPCTRCSARAFPAPRPQSSSGPGSGSTRSSRAGADRARRRAWES